jgi:hypothetical protein
MFYILNYSIDMMAEYEKADFDVSRLTQNVHALGVPLPVAEAFAKLTRDQRRGTETDPEAFKNAVMLAAQNGVNFRMELSKETVSFVEREQQRLDAQVASGKPVRMTFITGDGKNLDAIVPPEMLRQIRDTTSGGEPSHVSDSITERPDWRAPEQSEIDSADLTWVPPRKTGAARLNALSTLRTMHAVKSPKPSVLLTEIPTPWLDLYFEPLGPYCMYQAPDGLKYINLRESWYQIS